MTEHTTTPAEVPADKAAEICEKCSPASLGIYVVILSLHGKGHLPCQANIAERADVKRSTVRRHLTWLSRAGLIDSAGKMKLTEQQLEVLEFIEDYVEEHLCSPTIREIREGCGFGTYHAAWEKVSALDRKDFIEKEMYKERGIRLA